MISFFLGTSWGGEQEVARVKVELPEDPQATFYQVQLSEHEDFSKLYAAVTWSNRAGFVRVPVGRYYLRSRSLAASGSAGDWSATQVVTARPNPPALLKSVRTSGSALPTVLSWQPAAVKSKYIVVVYKDGKELLRKTVNEPSLTLLGLKRGNYYFTVCTIYEPKNDFRSPASTQKKPAPLVSQWAPPETIYLFHQPPEETLAPLYPGGLVPYSKEPLTFSWAPARKADRYEFRLFQKEKGKRAPKLILAHQTTAAGSRELASALAPGSYVWQVAAIDGREDKPVGAIESSFVVVDPLGKRGGGGKVELLFGTGKINYAVETPDYATALQPNTGGPILHASYFFTPQLGIEGGYQTRSFTLKGAGVSGEELFVGGLYHAPLFPNNNAFGYQVGLRAGGGSVAEIVPVSDTEIAQGSVSRKFLEPSAGIDWRLDQKTVIQARAAIIKDVTLSGGALPGSSGFKQSPSYSVEAEIAGAWFWPWGVVVHAGMVQYGFAHEANGETIKVKSGRSEFSFGLFYEF